MKPFVRFFLDAVFVVGIAAVTTGAAVGVHYLSVLMEQSGVDSFIVTMLHWVERVIAVFDCLGIVCGSAVSLYRFVHALREESAPPSREAL